MKTDLILLLIPLPPLLAFFLIVLLTNKYKAISHTIAIGSVLLSWLGSMVVFYQAINIQHLGEHPIISPALGWIPTGEKWLSIGMLIDPLSAVTLFFVAWTILMIFIYSIGYQNLKRPSRT